MMMAEAIVDIPRINELESVNLRRHSTGKVFLPNGGLTVLSRYLKTSQGSCHDLCKYGARGTLQTLSKSATLSTPRIVTPKRAGAGQTLERAQSNLGERRRKSEVGLQSSADFKILKPNDPIVIKIVKAQGEHHEENADANLTNLKPSADDPVDIKTVEPEDEENAETKFSGGNEPEVGPKPSLGSNNQKPFDPDCIESEVSSWPDKEFVSPSPKKEPLPLNETDIVIAQASDSKLKPRSKPSSFLRQSYSSGKLNTRGGKSGKTTSVTDDIKIVVVPSDSSLPRESGVSSSSMNVRKWKSKGVGHSKKLENAKQNKPENDKGSNNQKGVSHLMDQKNFKKPDSEECSFANITENEPGESIQNSTHASDFSTMPSSSSKDKSIKHTRNRIPIGQSPQSNRKQNMIYRPKGNRAHGPPPSFSSFPGKKGLRSTPYGRCVTQPSSTSSLPLISTKYSSMLPYCNALSQHDKVAAQKQKSSSKMMCRSRPKMAFVTTSEHKHLQGEKLNFQRDNKVIDFSESKGNKCNPENKPAKSIQNSGHAGRFSTLPSSSFKGKGMKLTQNRISTNQSSQSYEKKMIHRPKGTHVHGLSPSVSTFTGKKGLRSTPYGLHVSQPSLSSSSTSSKSPNHDASLSQHDEAVAQKQKCSSKMMYKGRPKMASVTTPKDKHFPSEKLNFQRGKVIEAPLEDCTPRRLAFKPRVHIDRKNGDEIKEKIEDCSPRRLKFKRRVLVDNRNGDDNKNGGEEFSPRRLKFRRRVVVDNRNTDNKNDKGEDYIPRKLKFWRRVLDDNKNGSIQNSEGDTSNKNNSEGRKADVDQNTATKLVLQSNKIFLKRNDVGKKKDSAGSLYNNMIEETTSRLARSKTSKVKALVSAFETVISDLDTKISTTSSSTH